MKAWIPQSQSAAVALGSPPSMTFGVNVSVSGSPPAAADTASPSDHVTAISAGIGLRRGDD